MAKKEVLGYEVVMDTLCKEVLTSCPINNEQMISQRAKHDKLSNGKLFLKLGWETYERIKKTLTRKQKENAFYELSRSADSANRFYKAGKNKGGESRKRSVLYYTLSVKTPREFKPIITKAAKEAGLSIAAFIKQAVYEKLGIEPGQLKKNSTQAEREDITTVDAVLPIKNLTGV